MDIFGFHIPKNIFVSVIIVVVSFVLYIIAALIVGKITRREKDPSYRSSHVEVGTIQENEIIFRAFSEYCEANCSEKNETTRKIEKDFVIVKDNDHWLIKNFYLPN